MDGLEMVRLATKEDIVDLMIMGAKHSESLGLPHKPEVSANTFTNLVKEKMVLIHDSKKAMLCFMILPWLLSDEYLISNELSYWVEPEVRGTGVSNQLIDAYLAECKKRNVNLIAMTHMNDSHGEIAKKIYEKKGLKLSELVYKLEDK